jgi:hypothetical protein
MIMKNLFNYQKAFTRFKHSPFMQGIASIINLAGNQFALHHFMQARYKTGKWQNGIQKMPENLKRPPAVRVASAA